MSRKLRTIGFDKKMEYEWLIISQSYLQSALMNARILKKKLSSFASHEGSPLKYCLTEIYGDYQQSAEYIVFPILFNLKHGIEIYLKAAAGMENSRFDEGHNLLDFLKRIEDKPEVNQGLKCLITKYAYSRLLLPSNSISDIENQFERYPQIKTTDWPYKNINLSIVAKKIDELIKDIEYVLSELRKYFLEIDSKLKTTTRESDSSLRSE